MTMGFKGGRFYRNARSPCVNLLLTYESGCAGNCGYCGLSLKREGDYYEKSFIRVGWPQYRLDDIIQKISLVPDKVKRICISMITNVRSIEDTVNMTSVLRKKLDIPVSILVAPTILKKEDMVRFKEAGVDKIGVAIDCATPEIFDEIRGSGVSGPHKWDRYWKCYKDSIEVFGKDMSGVHLIVGLGETEKDMITMIQKARDMGGNTHLFSFFPESGSALAERDPPPIGQYRRIQLARYLIDEDLSRSDDFTFDPEGRVLFFGLSEDELDRVIHTGRPFMTSGCTGEDGEVACNRPFANSLPGPGMRNFPFVPEEGDLKRIQAELKDY